MRYLSDYYDGRRPRAVLATLDIVEGLKAWQLWSLLGWTDILQRYRRSALGPFWLTISMGVTVGALGFLYASLFKLTLADYLPFLALGFIFWQFISGLLLDGCSVFIGAEGTIKQAKSPYSIHIYRVVCRNLIILAHNLVIYVAVALWFRVPVGWDVLFSLLGVGLVALNGVWAALILGMLCARYRDVLPIINSVIQLAFFVTPIIWKPELLADRAMFLTANPFYHFMEILRAPLLGEAISPLSWAVVGAITLGGWIAAFIAFTLAERRISYWL